MTLRAPDSKSSGSFAPLASLDGTLGYIAGFAGEVKETFGGWEMEEARQLFGEFQTIADEEKASGLSVKTLFFAYPEILLLGLIQRKVMLILLLKPGASLTEIESEARRLMVGALFSFGERPTREVETLSQPINVTAASTSMTLSAPSGPPPSDSRLVTTGMKWKEALQGLESILTKVMIQAQATRLIEAGAIAKGIRLQDKTDPLLFEQIGTALLSKIKHRSLRTSLTNEFKSLLERVS